MGRTVGMTIEITTYERPRRFASSIRMSAANIQGTLTFDPLAGGTRMRWAWEVRLRGCYKLMTPIIARSGRRQEQATWAGLKHVLEGRQNLVANAPPSGAVPPSHLEKLPALVEGSGQDQ
jgi:hypothetical protein